MSHKLQLPKTISAWQSLSYLRNGLANLDHELHFTSTRLLPAITRPDHVLVKVEAASLNPVDLLLLKGYGSSTFPFVRRVLSNFGWYGVPNQEYLMSSGVSDFPLTPGRDFAGYVVDLGPAVQLSKLRGFQFEIGDKVVGATWPFLSSSGSGSFAEYLVCPFSYIAQLPERVTFLQGAALSYAGLTAWSGLVDAGGLRPKYNGTNRTSAPLILIVGATGGVGLIASQLAKIWSARVHVICPGDSKAIALMKDLDVEEVIVYPDKPPITIQYDIILDCVRPDYLTPSSNDQFTDNSWLNVSKWTDYCIDVKPRLPEHFANLRPGSSSRYVCLNSPLLHLNDRLGPFLGTTTALTQLAGSNLLAMLNQKHLGWRPFQWAFFKASGERLDNLLKLCSSGQLHVPIDTVYSFDEVLTAFNRLQSGGVRGKLVIDMMNER